MLSIPTFFIWKYLCFCCQWSRYTHASAYGLTEPTYPTVHCVRYGYLCVLIELRDELIKAIRLRFYARLSCLSTLSNHEWSSKIYKFDSVPLVLSFTNFNLYNYVLFCEIWKWTWLTYLLRQLWKVLFIICCRTTAINSESTNVLS